MAIARALAMRPKVMLFDEATSVLHPELVGEVLGVIRTLAHEHDLTMLMVTHEMWFAEEISDRVVFLEGGSILEQGPPQQVFYNLRNERTRNFIQAVYKYDQVPESEAQRRPPWACSASTLARVGLMNPRRVRFLFLNFGHTVDHLLMLLFPTVVLSLETEFQRPFAELLPLATAGFVAFGACSLPAGWLGDRWNRRHMITVFFLGTGLSAIATGMARSTWEIAIGLTLIGVFGSIYHPVGVAMVVANERKVGRLLGINGVFGNLGVAGAALAAGWLTDQFGWRAAFIVPGAFVCGLGVLFALLAPPEPAAARSTGVSGGGGHSGRVLVTVFSVMLVASLFGGLMFSSTLVALPKMFAVRMSSLTDSTMGVGALVSLVYVFGAFAQILVGWLLDRYPVRWLLTGVAALQVPFVMAAATLSSLPLLIVSGLMMFTIFGAIPITDTLVARYAPDHLRSRVFAVKYVVALGISSVAVPLVAVIYGVTGDFAVLFACFGVFSLIVAAAALFLPRGAPAQVAEATA